MAIGFTALLTLHWCSKAGRAALLHREIKADGSRRWSCAGPWSLSGVAAAVPGTAHPRARPGLWGCWSPGLCWSRLMALIPSQGTARDQHPPRSVTGVGRSAGMPQTHSHRSAALNSVCSTQTQTGTSDTEEVFPLRFRGLSKYLLISAP